jgi:hypothetical protein
MLAGLALAVAALYGCGDGPPEAKEPARSGGERATAPVGTIFSTNPELCELVVWRDPRETARRLRAASYDVHWEVVDLDEDRQPKTVSAPPRGTVVLSVLAPDGSYEDVPPGLRQLSIEVTREPGDHPVAQDAACDRP